MSLQQMKGSVLFVETFVWWLFPTEVHILSPDKFPSRVPSTMDLLRVELPDRVSSISDLLSVQPQILGDDSIASPAEQFVPSPSSRDVSSAVRRECLIDVFLVLDAPHQIGFSPVGLTFSFEMLYRMSGH
jgi:hypothetical protein